MRVNILPNHPSKGSINDILYRKYVLTSSPEQLVVFYSNKTPAEAFTPSAEKKIGTKWALCTAAQAGNIKSGYLRILLYCTLQLFYAL